MSHNPLTLPTLLDSLFTWPVHIWRYCKYGYTFRRIHLGEGIYTILDQKDYYSLKKHKWIFYGRGYNLYAVRYKLIAPNTTAVVSLHSQIMQSELNARLEQSRKAEPRISNSVSLNPVPYTLNPNLVIDHINCNSLDNRRANLRLATKAENNRNRRKLQKASSKFIGVTFDKKTGRWASGIVFNKKRIWLGRFDNETDAAAAYDTAAVKYFGQFARLNFPKDDEKSIPLFTKISNLFSKLKSA